MKTKLLLITCALLVLAFGIQSVLAQPSYIPPASGSYTNLGNIILSAIFIVAVLIIVFIRIKLKNKNTSKRPMTVGNYCPSCGSQVDAGVAFCKNCGKKL